MAQSVLFAREESWKNGRNQNFQKAPGEFDLNDESWWEMTVIYGFEAETAARIDRLIGKREPTQLANTTLDEFTANNFGYNRTGCRNKEDCNATSGEGKMTAFTDAEVVRSVSRKRQQWKGKHRWLFNIETPASISGKERIGATSEASVKCDNRIRQHETKDSVCNGVSQALADCQIQAIKKNA